METLHSAGRLNRNPRRHLLLTALKTAALFLIGACCVNTHVLAQTTCEFENVDTANDNWEIVAGKNNLVFYEGTSGNSPAIPTFVATGCEGSGDVVLKLFKGSGDNATEVASTASDPFALLTRTSPSAKDSGVTLAQSNGIIAAGATFEYTNAADTAWGAAPVEYTIRAARAFADTLDDFTFTVTVLPAQLTAPSGVQAYPGSTESIYVEWTGDGAGDATHYQVNWRPTNAVAGARSGTSELIAENIDSAATAHSYTIQGLRQATQYAISVRAVAPNTEGNLYDDQRSPDTAAALEDDGSTEYRPVSPLTTLDPEHEGSGNMNITEENPIRVATGKNVDEHARNWIFPIPSYHDATTPPTFTYRIRSGNSQVLGVQFIDDGDANLTDHLVRLTGLKVGDTYAKVEAIGSDGSKFVTTLHVKVAANAEPIFAVTSANVRWDVDDENAADLTINVKSGFVSSQVSDEDQDELSFSMTGGEYRGVTYLEMDADTGVISVPEDTNLRPLETGVEFELTVTVSDNAGGTDSMTILVSTVDGDDRPALKANVSDIWLKPITESNGGGSRSISLEDNFEDPDGDRLCYLILNEDAATKPSHVTGEDDVEIAELELSGASTCKSSHLTVTMNLPSNNPTSDDFGLLGRRGTDEVEVQVAAYQFGDLKTNRSDPVTVKVNIVYGASNSAPAIRRVAKITDGSTFVTSGAHSVKENREIKLTFTADDHNPSGDQVCWSTRKACTPCRGDVEGKPARSTDRIEKRGSVVATTARPIPTGSHEYDVVIDPKHIDYETYRNGYTIELCATDLSGATDTISFVVEIENVEEAPSFKTIDDLYFVVGDYSQTVDLTDFVQDGDGLRDIVSYGAAIVGSSTAVSVDEDDGIVTVTPTSQTLSAKASVEIEVSATDTTGRKAYGYFTAHVKNSNRSPSFRGGLGSLAFNVPEDTKANTKVGTLMVADDSDSGDVITYSVSGSSLFKIDTSSSGAQLRLAKASLDFEGSQNVYNLVVTASDGYGGAATINVNVNVTDVNEKPVATRDAIPDQRILLGMSKCVVTASDHFSDPDQADKDSGLLIEATSTRPGDTRVYIQNNNEICIEGRAVGTGPSRITVTAKDRAGLSVFKRFRATVEQNNPPHTASTGGIPAMDVQLHGRSDDIDLYDYFDDGDDTYDETMTFSTNVNDTIIATASVVSGHMLRIYGDNDGVTTVTVTATDQNNQSHSQSFRVTVIRNDPPVANDDAIDDVVTRIGQSIDPIDASDAFEDEGDSFTLSAGTDNPDVATIALQYASNGDPWINVYVHSTGTTRATLTAIDEANNTASVSFNITVEEQNDPPELTNPIADVIVQEDERYDIELDDVFEDSDSLEIAVEIEDDKVADVVYRSRMNILRVYGYESGTTVVTVTATDTIGQSVSDEFEVTVTDNDPPVVATPLGDQMVFSGKTMTISLADVFTDPDDDALTYTAVSSNTSVATLAVTGASLEITGVAEGNATVTVTATDIAGLTAETSFNLVVEPPNDPPVLAIPFKDLTLEVGQHADVTLDGVFTDEGNLTYSVATEDQSIAHGRHRPSNNSIRVYGSEIGFTTLTVTATDDIGQTADDSFDVTVKRPNRPPVVVGEIDDQEMLVNGRVDIRVAGLFRDEGELTYSAASDDDTIADAFYRSSNESVRIHAYSSGSTMATLTATDDIGQTASISFAISVMGPPSVARAIADQTLTVVNPAEVSIADTFTDPDGDTLTYTAASSDEDVATVRLRGTDLTIHGVKVGTATITVTATDPQGLSATDEFEATVENSPPMVANEIEDQSLSVVEPAEVSLADTFMDPDGDRLNYSAESSDEAVATVSLSGTNLTVTGVKVGMATISVTATDPDGLSAMTMFQAEVENSAPTMVGTLDDQTVTRGEPETMSIAGVFMDPDGDMLTYTTTSNTSAIATATASGESLSIEGHAPGTATITVTASDPMGLSASGSFDVTVETIPEAVGSIDDVTLQVGGEPMLMNIAQYFEDDDGDALTYSVSRSGTAVEASLSGSELSVSAHTKGSSEITLTAADAKGRSATQSFNANVSDSEIKSVANDALAGVAGTVIGSASNAVGARLEGNRGNTAQMDFLPIIGGRDQFERVQSQPGVISAKAGAVGPAPRTQQPVQRTPAPIVRKASTGVSWGVVPGRFQEAPQSRKVDIASMLGNNFSYFLNGNGGLGSFSGWGTVDFRNFEGEGYDGNASAFFLGLDVKVSPYVLLGAAVGHNRSESDYSYGSATQTLETTVTSVLPYVSYKPNPRAIVWGVVGRGAGEATTTVHNADSESSDLTMNLGMFGASARFASRGATQFGIRGDAAFASLATEDGNGAADDLDAGVNRLRIGAEAMHVFGMADGSTVTPYGEVNLRYDGGDGVTGSGLELAGGVRIMANAFSLDARGHTVAAHSAEDFSESGVTLMATLNPSHGMTGLSMSLAPSWGNTSRSQSLVWADSATGSLPFNTGFGSQNGFAMNANIGYGFLINRDRHLMKPYLEYGEGASNQSILLGTEVKQLIMSSSMFDMNVMVGRVGSMSDSDNNLLEINATLQF